jgi:peptidoglycan/LPS O-acetylase OafA/YrhL
VGPGGAVPIGSASGAVGPAGPAAATHNHPASNERMTDGPSLRRSNLLLALGAALVLIGAAFVITEVRRTHAFPVGAMIAMLLGAALFAVGVRRGGPPAGR